MYKIGVSACFFHPDLERNIFKGKTLLYTEESMFKWLQRSGAFPVLIPTIENPISLEKSIEFVDGLLLSGGSDVSPKSYGEEAMKPEWQGDRVRDQYEIALVHQCQKQSKPIMGICRGLQVINVAYGGTLYQDINTQTPNSLVHRDAEKYDQNFHELEFRKGGRLAAHYETEKAKINSVHHQAIKELADGFDIEAKSTDDEIIEAIHHQEEPVFGVQWHPEFQDTKDKSLLPAKPLMDYFFELIEKAKS